MPRHFKTYCTFIIILIIGFLVLGCRVQNPFYLEERIFDVGGRVVDEEGEGLGNVRIEITDHCAVLTASNGNWEKASLRGMVSFTPVKEGYTFDPVSRETNKERQNMDFIAIRDTYSLSGTVADETGRGIEHIKISFSGGYTSVLTDENGQWEKENLTGEIEVIPGGEGWTFRPTSVYKSGESDTVDFTVTYEVSGVTIRESDGEELPAVTLYILDEDDEEIRPPAFSDDDGEFTIKGLSGVVRIEPKKEDWSFEPGEWEVGLPRDDINFMGIPD